MMENASAAVLALVGVVLVVQLAQKLRILWGLRGMSTAPGSLGVLLLGHTYALARAVGRYPCTWDLFSVWSQATAPVRQLKPFGMLLQCVLELPPAAEAAPQEPVRVQIFTQQCAVIGHPALMKRVLQTNQRNYAKDLEFSYSPFIDILGTGLVTSEGALWAKQRKLVSNAFRVEILDDIVGVALRAVKRLCARLELARGSGKPVEMAEEFRRLTLQVIGESLMSLAPEESDRIFPHLYLPIMEECNRRVLEPWRTYLLTPTWFRHRLNVRKLNEYIIGLIRSRWAQRQANDSQPRVPDMLDRIISGVEPGEWGSAAEKQLCYEIKTFVLAGHETSAAMLTWALFELSRNPDVAATVRAEATSVFGVPLASGMTKAPSREAVDEMPTTLAALKEALRLYSVVPVVTRVTVADDTLGTSFVPAGTRIILSMQGVHHSPSLWPQPHTFRVDRFLPQAQGAAEQDPYAFLPFINGPRNCLGQYLALLEARVVLGVLTQRFRFRPAHADTGRIDARMIPIGPAGGMHMLVD